jgi:hypothetical protein
MNEQPDLEVRARQTIVVVMDSSKVSTPAYLEGVKITGMISNKKQYRDSNCKPPIILLVF